MTATDAAPGTVEAAAERCRPPRPGGAVGALGLLAWLAGIVFCPAGRVDGC